MNGDILRADVVRPSALGAVELATWQQIQARWPALQRAFLTPQFALACEQANGRAYVAVLHHDLRADMRRACRLLLQARGVLPGRPVSIPSQVQVVTPYNEPASIYGYAGL